MEYKKEDVRKSVLDDYRKLRKDFEAEWSFESEEDRTDLRMLFIENSKRLGRLSVNKIFEVNKE